MRKRNPLTLSSITALILCAGCAGGKLLDSSASLLDDKRQPRPYPTQGHAVPASTNSSNASPSNVASPAVIGTGVSSENKESATPSPARASNTGEVTIANRHQQVADQTNVLQIPASRISNSAGSTPSDPAPEATAKVISIETAPPEVDASTLTRPAMNSRSQAVPSSEMQVSPGTESPGKNAADVIVTPLPPMAQIDRPITDAPSEASSPETDEPRPAEPTADELLPEDPQERIGWLQERLIKAMEDSAKAARQAGKKEEGNRIDQQLRLAYLLTSNVEEAVRGIEALPESEREAFKQMIFALSQFLSDEDIRRPTHRNARVAKALRDAVRELSPVSRLELKNLTFCERVEQFGWFTEFRRAEFTPKQQVILYVEIENATAEEKSQHNFETELSGSYQIFDDAGNLVHEKTLPLDKETCRNFRRDYFVAYRIYLPEEIGAGHYRLELTIEDLKAKRTGNRKLGEGLIEFRVR